MPQKLAIAISGAVSLGSYEAGVMYEIIEAIAQHNESLEPEHPDRIEIDVITGASAGAMTACILAQKLLFEGKSLRNANDNSLYQAWITDVDITKLLQLSQEDDPNKSILSSSVIKQIGYKHLLQRYNDSLPQSQRHPAAAKDIRLGLAMSNTNLI